MHAPRSIRSLFVCSVLALMTLLAGAPAASAAAFTAGNIVVYRVGTGAAALGSTATAVFVDEYTTAGTLVQSIAMPTAVAGAQRRLTAAGSSVEGFVNRSVDGQYLLLTGYDAALATAGVATSTSATVNRVIGRIDSSGAVDTSTALTDLSSGSSVRSATSTSGTDLWAVGGAGGVRYAAFGTQGASVNVSSTVANLRQVTIVNGQLYVTSASGANRVLTVGTGTPTTAGQTMTNFPGMPIVGPPAVPVSPYGVFFADLDGTAGIDTAYLADDSAVASGGGIQKWSLVSGTWTYNGVVFLTGGSARAVTGSVAGSTVTLYATTPTTIVRLVDSAGFNAALSATPTNVATAGTNTAFRGIAFAPATLAPTVSSITRVNTSPTNAPSVDFTVTFSQSVTGVDASDFALTTAGVTGASVTGVTGSGTTYTVSVNTGSGSGTLRLDLTDDDTIINGSSTPLGGAGAGNGNFTTGSSYTLDRTVPAVSSIVRTDPNPTASRTLHWTVTFSEPVTGFDAADLTVPTTGAVIAGTPVITGTGPYTVTVTFTGGQGTGQLSLSDNDSITDLVGNALGGPGAGNGDFAGETYTIDDLPTVLSIIRANTSPTNAASVGFTVTFSESVTGVDASDFALVTAGLTGSSISGVSGSGASYTVTVTTGTGTGTVGLNLTDNDSITDATANPLGGSGAGNGNFTGPVYSVDTVAPTVLSVVRVNTSPTSAATVDYTVTFSEAVTGVDTTDFALTTTGVTGASVTNVAPVSATVYTVTVNTGSGDGTIRLDVNADGTILDAVSNPLASAFTTGAIYTVQKSAPTVVSIVRVSASPTNAASVDFTVTFSGSVTGVDASDFALTTAGVAGASVSNVSGSGTTYTVSAGTGSGDGTIRLDVSDDDSILNAANTPLGGAGSGNGNFTTGQSYTIDKTAPSVVSIVRGSSNPTNASSVTFTVTFSESVTGVTAFPLTTTGLATAASVTNISGSGTTYTVTVDTGTGSGTIRLDVADDDSIVDAAGNPLGGPGAGNGDFTGGQIYTIDRQAPSVNTLVRADTNPTSAAQVHFTVTFTESVSGVDATDFTLVPSGLTGTSIAGVTGSGTTYTVTANTGSGSGTLGLNLVDNDSIVDVANNPLGSAGAGNGNFTGEVYNVLTVPAAPTGLSATPGNNSVALSWNATATATGYNVKRATVTGGPYTNVATNIASPSHNDTTAVNGTTYFYVVSALNASGEGANSSEVSATPAVPAAPPTGVIAAAGDGLVVLNWTATAGATSYNVKRSTVNGGPYNTTVGSPATPTFTDNTVTNGTPYYYVVTAVTGVESGPSAQVTATPNAAASLGVVISQIYGGGGNASAPYQNDYIELFNRGSQSVSLNGWSVQYGSATSATFSAANTTLLSGIINPGKYVLIRGAAGTSCTGAPCGVVLPVSADFTTTTNLSGTAGKVILVSNSTAFASNGCSLTPVVADFVGYGTGASGANCFQVVAAATLSNTTAAVRGSGGCTDTRNNGGDFTATAPNPHNSGSPQNSCGFGATGNANPSSVSSGGTTLLTVTVTPAPAPPSTGITVTADLSTIGGSATQSFFDNGTNGDVTPGDNIFSFSTTVTGTGGARTLPVVVADAQARATSTNISLTITPGLETIAAVKVDANADFVPDRNGQSVKVRGVVTSIDFRGGTGIEYYIQDATGAIDIFHSTTDYGPFTLGDNIEVVGTLTQFNGLTELTPTLVTALPGGTLPPVTPEVIALSQLDEPHEGKLVRVDNLTITAGSFPASGADSVAPHVTVTDGITTGTLRIDKDTDIDGTTAPAGTFSLIAIGSQFDSAAPFSDSYQLLPRSLADFIQNTPPSGSGLATPPSVAPGSPSLLTVTVTPGQNPASTGISVLADLTSIGGSATQSFFNDGSNGDATPGDNVWSYNATVSAGTSVGAKTLNVTIADAQARATAATISLNIQSAGAPPVPLNLVATPGNAQVGLSWSSSAGATGYNVKRATVSGGPYTTIAADIAPSSYTDTSVTNSVHYYYVVSALSGVNESGNSTEASALPAPPPPSGTLAKIYFVDIGQGAGTLIVGPPPGNKTLLVDGGETGKGNAKVIPLLNTLGISTIDYTIVTHYHVDHDAGMTEVINAGRVAGTAYDNGDAVNVQPPVITNSTGAAYTAYKNAILAHPAVTRQTITPGTVIDLGGGMRATCLVAGGNLLGGSSIYISPTDLNSESISVLIEYNNFDFLVSGDLTGGGSTTTAKTPDVETYVAQLAGDVDAVQLDHHGSTTANNRRFLGQLKAEVALASVGATNTFGHPNRETANKYLNIPATNGNTYGGTGIPNPGNGPVFYQTDPSPATDTRCTLQGYSGADAAHAGLGTVRLTTDGTTSYTMDSFDDGGVRISAAAHVYALDNTGAGITTNFPPTVVPNLVPGVPLASDVVTVAAMVRDSEDAITSVTLSYAIDGAVQAPVTMTVNASPNVYEATIAPQPDGTRVDYTVSAVAGGKTTSYSSGYFAGITPISTLRAVTPLGEPLYLDYAARVQGVVTAGTGSYSASTNDDYLQDATGAINIFRTIEPTSPAPQPTSLGSTYTVAGLIGQNTGRLRLEVTPPFDGVDKPWAPTPGSYNPYQIALVAPGSAPAPVAKTIAQLNAASESFEAKLVTITGCTVTSGTIPATNTGVDSFLTITDGTGSFQLKVDHDTDIPGLTTPASSFTVTGIIQQDDPLRPFDAFFDIAPRSRADLGAAAAGPSLITIADARADIDPTTGLTPDDYVPDRLNQTVKIRGVVTSINFRPTGLEYYIEDPTGGVDIFNASTIRTFAIGDNLEVIGQVQQFNGLTEINPGTAIANITVLPAGTLPAVTPQIVTLSQLADSGPGESFEGRLLRVNNVTITAPPATFAANTNYTITDSTGSVQMRIDGDTDIDGTAPPAGTFSVIGVLGQFDSAGPFDSGYQFFPRIRATDFLPAVATPATITVFAGSPQSAGVDTAFATNLQAEVRDSGNATIAGASVTFTAPASGASGTFAGSTTVTTNASGIATAPVFTANAATGTYNVVASTTNALTASFSLTNTPPTPAAMSPFAGTPQSATVNAAFATALQAKVVDAGNNPLSGISVTFSAPASGASGAFSGSTTVLTDGSGVATAPTFTANGTAGAYNVTATAGALNATFNLTNTAGAAAAITANAGTPQSAAINTAFATALQAKVTDAGNNPLSGVSVTFSAPASGASGSFSGSTTVVTDASGLATAPSFTANGTAGSYSVTATAGALTATFSLTNTAGGAAAITANAGTPQSATINTAFGTALQAKVTDAGSNPLSGVSVTFSAPASGASGAFSGSATVLTDALGLATAPAFTANAVAGSYNVTATAGALTATFALTNNAGPAAIISSFAGTPQSAAISTAFPTALQAQVTDASNNPLSGVSVTFTAPPSGASGAFSGSATVLTNASGIATAPTFTANATAGSYNVVANAGALTTNFALTNLATAPAAIVTIAGTPQSTNVNTAFSTALQAKVTDGGNNPLAGVSVTFTAPASGASGSFAASATVVTNASGIATAPAFTANAIAGSYNVVASASGGALTANFALTNLAVPPAAVAAVAGTPQSATVNTAFSTALQAKVTDAGNNPLSGISVTFTAPASGASGSFASSAVVVTNASGIATAPAFTANGTAGSYNVVASVGALTANFALTNTAPVQVATHFSVTAPATPLTVGVPFNITVTALDASNATVPGYTGTVHFTSTGADTLPANYTFTGGDAGTHSFSVTMSGTPRTITATDTVTAITGNVTVTLQPAGCTPPAPITYPAIIIPAVCANSSGNSTTTAGPATWSITNGTITAGQGTNTITWTAGASGTVSIVATLTPSGCVAANVQPYTAAIRPLPGASLPAVISACPGVSVTIPVTLTGTAPFSITWSDGFTQNSIAGNTTSRSITTSFSRILRITSITDAGCTTTTATGPSVGIAVTAVPHFITQSADVKIHGGETTHLTATVTGADIHFQWYQGLVGDESHPVGDDVPEFTTPALRETTVYWLKASNHCTTASSAQFTVQVVAPKRRAVGK
jgi:beta-lactamase superfamily II metal-dependent hydrolase